MKKQNSKKRIIIGLFILVALIVGAVQLTLAYFTATTSEKNNVFTVGNVSASLSETAYDALTAEQKVLVPGRTIAKNPTITVKQNSEAVYARAFVKIETSFYNILDGTAGLPTVDSNWTLSSTKTDGIYTVLEYRYNSIVAKNASSDTVLNPLFTQIKISTNATVASLALVTDPTIKVVGQIIQTEGFANAGAAFTSAGTPTGF